MDLSEILDLLDKIKVEMITINHVILTHEVIKLKQLIYEELN